MARCVITQNVTVPAGGGQVAKTFTKGQVVELSAAEQTALTTAGGTLRTSNAQTSQHDAMGEASGVHNSI